MERRAEVKKALLADKEIDRGMFVAGPSMPAAEERQERVVEVVGPAAVWRLGQHYLLSTCVASIESALGLEKRLLRLDLRQRH